jgi:hypothetical protein
LLIHSFKQQGKQLIHWWLSLFKISNNLKMKNQDYNATNAVSKTANKVFNAINIAQIPARCKP